MIFDQKLILSTSMLCLVTMTLAMADTVEEIKTIANPARVLVQALPQDVITQVTSVSSGVTDLVKQVKRVEIKLNLILERVISRKREISAQIGIFEKGVDEILALLGPPRVTEISKTEMLEVVEEEDDKRRKRRHQNQANDAKTAQRSKRDSPQFEWINKSIGGSDVDQKETNLRTRKAREKKQSQYVAQNPIHPETIWSQENVSDVAPSETKQLQSQRRQAAKPPPRLGRPPLLPAAGTRVRRSTRHAQHRFSMDGSHPVLVERRPPAAAEVARLRRRAQHGGSAEATAELWRQAELGPGPEPARRRRKAAEDDEPDPVPNMDLNEQDAEQSYRETREAKVNDENDDEDDNDDGDDDEDDNDDNDDRNDDDNDVDDNDDEKDEDDDDDDDNEKRFVDSEQSDDGGEDAMMDADGPVFADGSKAR